MKTNLMEVSPSDSDIDNLVMEARNMQVAIEQQMLLLDIPANTTPTNWDLGLESEEEPDAKKKTVLEKLWDFIIRMLKAVLHAFVKFMTGIDLGAQAKRAKQAEDIVKNKAKGKIDFAHDVVKQLSDKTLAIIHAIEKDRGFIKQYNQNLEFDKKINVSSVRLNMMSLRHYESIAHDLEMGLGALDYSIKEAVEKDRSELSWTLLKVLDDGLSINGSENAAYLKSFEKESGREKKYETLTKAAEEFKRHYAPEEQVALMRKIATTLSKQFAMEVRVVDTYISLSKAIIAVNNKIYAGT